MKIIDNVIYYRVSKTFKIILTLLTYQIDKRWVIFFLQVIVDLQTLIVYLNKNK